MGWLKLSIFSWLGILAVTLFATEKWITWSLLMTGITAIAILDHIKRDYWRKLGIATADGNLPILGHMMNSMNTKVMAWEPTDKNYQMHKKSKYFGFYFLWQPNLTITDPEVVKQITIKD